MKHIKNCLFNIKKTSSRKNNWRLMLMQSWNSIIGNLSSKVSIHKIYNNAITLGVSDSSWMQELYLLSSVIKEKINKAIDKPRIETVRFQYVPPNKKRTIKKNKSKKDIKEKTLSTREKKALDKVQDQELAQALTRLLQKCHQSS